MSGKRSQYQRWGMVWMWMMMLCLMMAGCMKPDFVEEETIESTLSTEESAEPSTEETTGEDAYAAQVQAYWDSFQVGSTNPQITDKSEIWYADLNHDGVDEQIVFDWGYMTPGYFAIFAVLDSAGEVLYMTDPAVCHAGWMTYYLCEMDGREYLLSYTPYEGTGGADYGFQLMEWNEENEIVTVDHGYVAFRFGDGEYFAKYEPEWYMDIPAMVEFAMNVNRYLEHSTLLFSTDEGWLGDAIRVGETGQFVLGSVDNPYRQYENYCGTGRGRKETEKNPTAQELQDILVAQCERLDIPYTLNGFDVLNRPQPLSEDECFTLWQKQLETYQPGSTDPQISYKSESWYADLDHDGVNERIVFDRYYWDSISRGIFAVLESNGQVVYVDDGLDTSHVGWATYYVCRRDDKEYLLWYAPHVSTGIGEYQYKLMELSASGELLVVEQDETFFEANPVQYVRDARPDYTMDIGDMAVFAENVNALLDTSYLVISTDQDWMSWDLSQNENGFVWGHRESPRRQYENFRARTGKVRATVRPEPGAIYEQLKTWCEAEGMPYVDAESSMVWYADLTHDGQPEEIAFDWSWFEGGGIGNLSVRDDWDSAFFSAEILSTHGHSSTYYLCQWQGQDYLFYYKPYIIMGEGYNRYELFYLTATGEKVVVDSGEVRFYVDHLSSIVNEYGKKVMDIPAMVRFAETIDRYVASSYLLVCSDGEWLPMPYSEGREYVVGSPEEPYRVSETYSCFDYYEDEMGQDLSSITDVAQKLKVWCEWAKMPYVE